MIEINKNHLFYLFTSIIQYIVFLDQNEIIKNDIRQREILQVIVKEIIRELFKEQKHENLSSWILFCKQFQISTRFLGRHQKNISFQ